MSDFPLYQQLFACIPIGAVILTPSDTPTILDVNEALLHNIGHARDQLLGQRLFDIFPDAPGEQHDSGVNALRRSLADVIRTGQPQSLPTQRYPIRITAPDGTESFIERFWNATNTPIFDAAGQLRCILHVTVEVTAQKQTEEALRLSREEAVESARRAEEGRSELGAMDRRKDEFLAMLAHELRNPLAPIQSAAEFVSRQTQEPPLARASSIILRQVRHMTGMVDELLDASRVNHGRIALDRATLDIATVIGAAAEQVRPTADARGHTLTIDAPTGQLRVCGDFKRLVQVIANVLQNAVKYTPDGGRVELRAEAREGGIVVLVRDNGIGMSPDLIEHAFELFTQAERRVDRSQGGLGIGLAVVKRIVELHDGFVRATSAGLGQGSCFEIGLPRLAAAAPSVSVPALPASASDGGGLRVLIVEDNPDIAETLAMVVHAGGHDVVVEHAAPAALDAARRVEPDVCLLDIGLPDMNGYELAQHLRATPHGKAATLVAITGYGRAEDRAAALRAGFDHHLVKPVDIDTLGRILAGVARRA
jgi:signal transduction histidine kinase